MQVCVPLLGESMLNCTNLCMCLQVNKVVLAYSGGLDTSVILKWLQETYECEVVTFTADLGQVRGVTCSILYCHLP